jgi:hypothetical protein
MARDILFMKRLNFKLNKRHTFTAELLQQFELEMKYNESINLIVSNLVFQMSEETFKPVEIIYKAGEPI